VYSHHRTLRREGKPIFQDALPSPVDDWRHVIHFGRNVASYKFALATALLDLGGRQQTFVTLADLAAPFAAAVCEHLKTEDRQTTSAGSRFLDTCRAYNRGEIDHGALVEQTVRLGFGNVIDAFHIARGGDLTRHRFFVDERKTRKGISLTDDMLALATARHGATVLPKEIEARWSLVESAWGLGLGTRIVSFEMRADPSADNLYAPRHLRRTPVTGVREALSGYQHGRCAYCGTPFDELGPRRVAVDHVLPFILMTRGWPGGDLHQVWNFVLACFACNSAKRDRLPSARWMPRLQARNEHFIASHHPLRETLVRQLGATPGQRYDALHRRHGEAIRWIPSSWSPPR
jgi:5-methylcytosine-specific restriction endonuclease McrA